MTKKNGLIDSQKIVTDRAIQDVTEDSFHVKERLVIPMLDVIQDNGVKPCTVALMGEWGSGKTSALNLLRNELRGNNNIVIDFDPLLEGKLELHELLESFYFKLYSSLSGKKAYKKTLGKILKSLILLSRVKCSLSGAVYGLAGHLPVSGEAKVEYDAGKNLDAVMEVWRKEQPQLYSEKVSELNSQLKGTCLYVIIDEIDRLPSKLILNFLMFARVLESFDNMVCIVAFDYTQITKKLISENALGSCDYASAAAYIDKLFQVRFDVCNMLNSDSITRYATKKIKIIFQKDLESTKILDKINSNNETQQTFQKILTYLSTPRQINKWLMNLLKNKDIIIKSPNTLEWLMFIATYTKFPIILDKIIRNLSVPYLETRSLGLRSEVEKIYGKPIDQNLNDESLILFLIGIKPQNLHSSISLALSDQITCNAIIDDNITGKYLATFFKNTPKYLISVFLNGVRTKDELNYFEKFFNGNINDVLYYLSNNDQTATELLAEDLAKALNDERLAISAEPDVIRLNNLWCCKVGKQANLLGNPYGRIIFPLLKTIPVENVIAGTVLSLSEDYIGLLLGVFGVKNKGSAYNLNDFSSPNKVEFQQNFFMKTVFKNKHIENFDLNTLKGILKIWLDKVMKSLADDKDELWLGSEEKISVLYRYIQWSNALGIKNPKDILAEKIKSFFENDDANQKSKKGLIEELIVECKKWLDPELRGHTPSPIESLFNNALGVTDSMTEIGSYLKIPDVELIKQVKESCIVDK